MHNFLPFVALLLTDAFDLFIKGGGFRGKHIGQIDFALFRQRFFLFGELGVYKLVFSTQGVLAFFNLLLDAFARDGIGENPFAVKRHDIGRGLKVIALRIGRQGREPSGDEEQNEGGGAGAGQNLILCGLLGVGY